MLQESKFVQDYARDTLTRSCYTSEASFFNADSPLSPSLSLTWHSCMQVTLLLVHARCSTLTCHYIRALSAYIRLMHSAFLCTYSPTISFCTVQQYVCPFWGLAGCGAGWGLFHLLSLGATDRKREAEGLFFRATSNARTRAEITNSFQ